MQLHGASCSPSQQVLRTITAITDTPSATWPKSSQSNGSAKASGPPAASSPDAHHHLANNDLADRAASQSTIFVSSSGLSIFSGSTATTHAGSLLPAPAASQRFGSIMEVPSAAADISDQILDSSKVQLEQALRVRSQLEIDGQLPPETRAQMR